VVCRLPILIAADWFLRSVIPLVEYVRGEIIGQARTRENPI
jgi:hypothetical protein